MFDVAPGTIVVFADIACPWTHLCLHRLARTRAALLLDDEVVFDMRAFPLELFNGRPTPKPILDAEVPVVGALDPSAGWRVWARQAHDYPVTTLVALEAVQAAKEQGLRASEALHRALQFALFAECRNISMHHEIIDVAKNAAGVDTVGLEDALVSGRARAAVFGQRDEAERIGVEGSPHLYLPDGSDIHNPGIAKHWEGRPGDGFPVVDDYRPQIYEQLLQRAAG